ncbi:Site-specific recombinase XerD [Mucilaginibacter gossypiicola]|uniref:Site-specific recombinase XerD n=1 Tax=Mucilaginibacter gossypiicola TaxID=551995 RepID=A0A1H8U521_9SPHI|nr:site-specific integrase [Mucilaginibacter gossypiicola]SEO98370.1 Site-specific recombinase XerD [Mucilaginibacter gossypiicola]
MKTIFSVLFYLKRPKSYQTGPMPIYMRITIDSKRTEITTGRECEPSQWIPSAGRMKGTKETVKSLNNYLDTLRAKIDDAHSAMIKAGDDITSESLKCRFLGKEENPKMLIEIFENHNEKFGKLVGKENSKGTLSRYKISLSHTQRFLKWRFNLSDIPVKKVDHQFITDYDFWLRSERNCGNNSAVKYMRNFKKIITICLDNGWIDRNPFLKYKGKTKRVNRICLEQDDLKRIAEKNFSSARLEQIRDIFLFSCYTGLAYIDIKNLHREHLTNRYDGEIWIMTNRQKTDIPTRVPLLPQAIELIRKYEYHPKCANTGLLFPVPSNQKVNDYLKEIAELCKIKQTLTFHIARHTFATTITLANDVPIESVSVMLGHASIKTTQEYAKVLNLKLSRDMSALRSKIGS